MYLLPEATFNMLASNGDRITKDVLSSHSVRQLNNLTVLDGGRVTVSADDDNKIVDRPLPSNSQISAQPKVLHDNQKLLAKLHKHKHPNLFSETSKENLSDNHPPSSIISTSSPAPPAETQTQPIVHYRVKEPTAALSRNRKPLVETLADEASSKTPAATEALEPGEAAVETDPSPNQETADSQAIPNIAPSHTQPSNDAVDPQAEPNVRPLPDKDFQIPTRIRLPEDNLPIEAQPLKWTGDPSTWAEMSHSNPNEIEAPGPDISSFPDPLKARTAIMANKHIRRGAPYNLRSNIDKQKQTLSSPFFPKTKLAEKFASRNRQWDEIVDSDPQQVIPEEIKTVSIQATPTASTSKESTISPSMSIRDQEPPSQGPAKSPPNTRGKKTAPAKPQCHICTSPVSDKKTEPIKKTAASKIPLRISSPKVSTSARLSAKKTTAEKELSSPKKASAKTSSKIKKPETSKQATITNTPLRRSERIQDKKTTRSQKRTWSEIPSPAEEEEEDQEIHVGGDPSGKGDKWSELLTSRRTRKPSFKKEALDAQRRTKTPSSIPIV